MGISGEMLFQIHYWLNVAAVVVVEHPQAVKRINDSRVISDI